MYIKIELKKVFYFILFKGKTVSMQYKKEKKVNKVLKNVFFVACSWQIIFYFVNVFNWYIFAARNGNNWNYSQ